ncbi:hypothetical protein CN526_28270, partial [Bacillus wiedmannii]|uniref:type I polyketide synthase n=1 Tax=Bacillus wiedmannii TaxID=1890302 RepID=UPI000BFABD27
EHSEVVQEFYHVDNVKEKVIPDVPKKSVLSKYKRQGRTARFLVRDESQTIPEPIAIIGMSGRFPQARNINEMWKILTEGKDVVQEIPPERFDWRKYYSNSGEPGKTNGKWCGSIPGVDEFDPLFFEISPREAKNMDPRQRLLLQESWKALEDAGYGEKQIKNSQIGMFVGVEDGDYQRFAEDNGNVTSNHNAILAARLSYFLNLNGPNMAINTACSSGLVAAHQACMSLRNHECDTAIAAGVNLIFTPESYIGMSEVGMLSSDGKCFAFDKRANGMVPGEAVVAVVLKRLSQAEADGDPIYAVIPGSGINYDGKTNGITAPSGASQTNLLKSVYDQYQINPEEIEYIVTHGTGTKLGDPIEINALYNAFKGYTEKQGYCAITSTKTNFGHTFAASGLVSLVSLVQAFRHKIIPASLHCKQENDYINWKESPFYVNKANKLWPEKNGANRMGAISAFGMSGTNAHMVLQSYNEEVDTSFKAPYYLLAFSAKSQEALQEKIKDMMSVLQDKERQVDLSQISYTLLEGRHHFTHRCAVVIQDQEDAMYVLNQMKSRERLPNLFRGKVSRDFKGQKVIEEYAQDLIKQSHSLQDNQNKYKDILYALADLYCQGYEIPWEQLFGNIKIRRIGLPTYPFVREQYWTSKSNKSRDERIPLQTNERKTKPVIAQQSLQPKTTNTNVSKNTNKPSGIILSALSDYQIVKSQPTNKPEQSIILKLPEMPLLQSKINNKSKTYIQSAFSLESLQKELVMSLAEILYIEHSNIDIDRQFIDMGMDSIIGVEWIKVVNKQYGISIKATKIYAYPTIRDFAEFLQEELTKQGDCVADSPETFVSSEYETKEPVYLAQSNLVKSLQKELVMSLAEILYMEHSDIDIDRQFIDMGMDSIIGVEWIKAINIQYGVSIKATKIYAYPTIRDFAEFLQEELTKQGNRFSDSPETFVSNESKTKEPVSSLSVGKKIDFGVPTQNLSIVQKPVHLVQSNSVESLQKELIMSLAEILYIEHSNIDIDRRFIDMGMDSIIGVEWIKVVNKQYGISIKATKIYAYPTVRNFAEFLQKELNKRKQELNQLSPQSNLSINNLDEILLQVAHGTLDIKLADQLLQNLQIKE